MNAFRNAVGMIPTALAIALILGGPLGCRHAFHSGDAGMDIECDSIPPLTWMSPIIIVPECSTDIEPEIMLAFCHELATALQEAGVTDVIVDTDCGPCCAGFVDEIEIPPTEPLSSPASIRLTVGIHDFQPYRPMRMAVDVSGVQTADHFEVFRVSEVYFGPQESPLVKPRRRWGFLPAARREHHENEAARTAFVINSPRNFLTHCAHRVVVNLQHGGAGAIPVP